MENVKFLTLNIMHGRNAKSSVFPIFTKRTQILSNLRAIAELIRRESPDVVGLQEVDRSAFTSGWVDEVAELTQALSYPYHFYAEHINVGVGPLSAFASGVAIFSRFPIKDARLHTFPFSFPTVRKGFLVATLELSPSQYIEIAVVHMVHLDVLRRNSRLKQAQQLVDTLKRNALPKVLLGDFNAGFHNVRKTTLPILTQKLNLAAYQPQSTELNTHPATHPLRRIDWIFVSPPFKIETYEVLQDNVSDHLPVIASCIID